MIYNNIQLYNEKYDSHQNVTTISILIATF